MRSVFLICRSNIRRSRYLIILAVLAAGLLAVVFFGGRSMGKADALSGVSVGVIDHDKSAVSEDMVRYMEERLQMHVLASEGENAFRELKSELLDCRISVILEIPEGFEEALLAGRVPEITMTGLDDYENAAFTESYLENYLSRTAMLARAAGGDREKLAALLEEAKEGGRAIRIHNGSRVDVQKAADEGGFALMSGFFAMIGGGLSLFTGLMILEDKQNGTFKRMQGSNVKPRDYVAGTTLGGISIAVWMVAGVLALLWVTGADLNIPLWIVGALYLEWMLFNMGFQMMTAHLVKSSWVHITICVGFVSITNILGGAFFPLGDNVLARFSALTPSYYLMETVYGFQNDPGYACGRNLLILLLMTVLTYLIAAVAFVRKED